MGGLVDSDTGLAFGESLVWQDPIGGDGLVIVTETPELELLWGEGNFLLWGGLFLTWGLE